MLSRQFELIYFILNLCCINDINVYITDEIISLIILFNKAGNLSHLSLANIVQGQLTNII